MIKSISLATLIIIFLAFLGVGTISVFGQEASSPATPEGRRINPTIKKELIDSSKEQILSRVRMAVVAWWLGHKKIADKEQELIQKLEVRVNKAKLEGLDTTGAEEFLADAKERLEKVNQNLNQVQGDQGKAVTRSEFLAIKTKFKAIKINLQEIRKDASEIIRILKGYNSATSQGQGYSATRSAKPISPAPAE